MSSHILKPRLSYLGYEKNIDLYKLLDYLFIESIIHQRTQYLFIERFHKPCFNCKFNSAEFIEMFAELFHNFHIEIAKLVLLGRSDNFFSKFNTHLFRQITLPLIATNPDEKYIFGKKKYIWKKIQLLLNNNNIKNKQFNFFLIKFIILCYQNKKRIIPNNIKSKLVSLDIEKFIDDIPDNINMSPEMKDIRTIFRKFAKSLHKIIFSVANELYKILPVNISKIIFTYSVTPDELINWKESLNIKNTFMCF